MPPRRANAAPSPPTPKRSARKPARTTRLAARPSAVHPRWLQAATRVIDDANPLAIPYDIFLNEARGVAGFVTKRWHPVGGTPGLSRVRNLLPESTPTEIVELIDAVQTAHTEATLTVAPAAPADTERAQRVVAELARALAFTLDADAAGSDDAQRLARVRAFHDEHGVNPAALGQDLRNHAALADSLRARLTADDAGFDAALIDEAITLAATLLRLTHAPAAAAADEGACSLRNRLLRLLSDRVALVRRCARRVFSAHPDVLREVISAYERERRARNRRARAATTPSVST